MKFVRKKTTASLIALFLTLTITATLVALPNANAQEATHVYEQHIYVAPSPVGAVGHEIFIVVFTDNMAMPCDWDDTLGATGNRETWVGITVTIMKPDGTNETVTLGPSDPVGANYYMYTPTEVGEYSVQAHFPATWKNFSAPLTYGLSTYRRLPPGDYFFTAADSEIATFTVREEPVSDWPNPPLPTEYWMRPIVGPANTWSVLASNALGNNAEVYPQGAAGGAGMMFMGMIFGGSAGGATSPYYYGSAPESAHILWTRQYFPTGSIVDTRFGSQVNYYGGYQPVRFSPGPIVDGKMHVTLQKTVHDSSGVYEIWDLYTGEVLRSPEESMPSSGQVYWYDSPNQAGCAVYLWQTRGVTLPEIIVCPQVEYLGPNKLPLRLGAAQAINTTETPVSTGSGLWKMLDAYTGETICYVANMSSGSQVYSKRDGSMLFYNARNLGTSASPNYYLQVWNSSAGTMVSSGNGTGAWQWRPSGGCGAGAALCYLGSVASNYVHDGNLMWSLNVSIPDVSGLSIRAVREGEYIIFGSTGTNNEDEVVPGHWMAFSLEEGAEGNKLWESTVTPPFSSTDWYSGVSFSDVFPEQDVLVWNSKTELKNPIVYDLKTGEKLWEGDASEERQLSYYGFRTLFYDDMIITGGSYSGVLTAYEARTGEVRWQYTAVGEGTDSPYGNDQVQAVAVSDGKLYTSISEHSESSPLWRSPGLKCINITSGEEIWKILFWATNVRVTDGILTSYNTYDGQVYAFGKGPSATTITASPKTSVHGTSVMVEGTVTDQTATGRRNVNNDWQFALKDTPAISDEDMQAWMQYKFMGQGYPADAKGVEVVLTVVDPNSNVYEIGRVTSDIEGNYALPFEPLVPGTYQIIAAFEGSASYYQSSATTYIDVEEAPAATPEPTPTPASIADMYFVPATIGVIVAIIVVGAIMVLMLRKR